MRILIVALGGALGSSLRYLTAVAAHATGIAAGIVPTLIVNVVGCFLIGALSQWYETRGPISESWRLFLAVGVLGGFTTFSALATRRSCYAGRDVGLAMANREELVVGSARWPSRLHRYADAINAISLIRSCSPDALIVAPHRRRQDALQPNAILRSVPAPRVHRAHPGTIPVLLDLPPF